MWFFPGFNNRKGPRDKKVDEGKPRNNLTINNVNECPPAPLITIGRVWRKMRRAINYIYTDKIRSFKQGIVGQSNGLNGTNMSKESQV